MKLFRCANCANIVYFENRFCGRCGARFGYDPARNDFVCESSDSKASPVAFKLCANSEFDACNWLADPESSRGLCLSCQHNGIIPDLSDSVRLDLWRKTEVAQHRLFYSLLRWKLPLRTRIEDPSHGLVFDILADPANGKVLTGHDEGLITIALAEADDLERENRRISMGEPYRTLLGHFRHEVGHYFWEVLIREGEKLESFRQVFGDEQVDYGAAIAAHYANGSPANWQEVFVSAYASCHPWEDFAETWAHYFHIVDTLEMANAFGVKIDPRVDVNHELATPILFDPYREEKFQKIVDAWIPFVFAINNINRAMGRDDLYPFILSARVIEKLGFIHALIRGQA
jgi:hypothetical protein